MAPLPDPTDHLDAHDRAAADHMARVRAGAEGTPELAGVYRLMFNNPGVAEKVGALGEHLRFGGTLPGDVRELVILRYASDQGFGYEWAHHHHVAIAVGIPSGVLDAVGAGQPAGAEELSGLRDDQRAAIQAVDAVAARVSIPENVQQRFVAAHGDAGIVELVALCGLYATMGYMTVAFDIPIEPGLPSPPPASPPSAAGGT